ARYDDEPLPDALRQVVLALTGLTFGLGALALLCACWYHRFPPLKAKHLPLVSAYYVGAFLWYFGHLQTQGIFGYGGIWQYCQLWGIWIQYVFGVMLTLGIFNYRLYALYIVFVCGRSFAEAPKLLLVICYFIPIIAIALVGVVESEISLALDDNGSCQFTLWYKIALLAVLSAAQVVGAYLSYLVRNIRRSFNEYHEQRIGLAVAFTCITLNGVMILGQFNYLLYGKLIMLFANLAAANVYFWLVLGPPLYGCLFHRKRCLRNFIANLELDSGDPVNHMAGNRGSIITDEPSLTSTAPSTPMHVYFRPPLTQQVAEGNANNMDAFDFYGVDDTSHQYFGNAAAGDEHRAAATTTTAMIEYVDGSRYGPAIPAPFHAAEAPSEKQHWSTKRLKSMLVKSRPPRPPSTIMRSSTVTTTVPATRASLYATARPVPLRSSTISHLTRATPQDTSHEEGTNIIDVTAAAEAIGRVTTPPAVARSKRRQPK
ncbi:hypothetical protein THASP1DRAFT_26760, partial [Thamnocephalis sphaerospora]